MFDCFNCFVHNDSDSTSNRITLISRLQFNKKKKIFFLKHLVDNELDLQLKISVFNSYYEAIMKKTS